jgi:hypothetical protein
MHTDASSGPGPLGSADSANPDLPGHRPDGERTPAELGSAAE